MTVPAILIISIFKPRLYVTYGKIVSGCYDMYIVKEWASVVKWDGSLKFNEMEAGNRTGMKDRLTMNMKLYDGRRMKPVLFCN